MAKFTIKDLNTFRERAKKELLLSEKQNKTKITVHLGTCGLASGAGNVLKTLEEEIKRRNLKGIIVTSSGCAGLCSREPMATIEVVGEPPVKYVDLNEKKIVKILYEHVVKGNIVHESVLSVGCERIC